MQRRKRNALLREKSLSLHNAWVFGAKTPATYLQQYGGKEINQRVLGLCHKQNRSQLDATHVSCSKHRSAKQTCSYRKKIYKVVLRPKSTPSETIGLSSHVQKNQITQTATSRSHKSNLKVT